MTKYREGLPEWAQGIAAWSFDYTPGEAVHMAFSGPNGEAVTSMSLEDLNAVIRALIDIRILTWPDETPLQLVTLETFPIHHSGAVSPPPQIEFKGPNSTQ